MKLADAAKRADAICRAQTCLRPQSSLKLRRTINFPGQKPADIFVAEVSQRSRSSLLATARRSVELRAPLRSSSRRACANAASRARPGATDLAMRRGRSTGGQMRPPVRRPRQMAEACSATALSYAKAPDPSWPPRRNGASPSPVPADRRRHHRYSSPVLQPRQQPPARQQPPRHVPAPRQAPPPPPTAQTIQPSPHSRSGTIFGFIIAAFVLLCSGAVSVYYVWYSHGEFVRQRTTELNRFDAQGPRTETPVEAEPPFLAGLPARPNGEQPPASQMHPETTTATSTKREMYFGTPLGRRRALKLRPEDDTASELASRRHRCMTRFCQERTDAVLSALNWTIDPCTDFRGVHLF
ncbi:hypothetical protein HPB51_016036 [Rhipicephalus microplus]|uniref:Uncharacterized protein n=1 Tax=Rhipicephalus microplus TaxID=6941 RepID=A0A9J6DI89_RHIMP|nr:hypothetical protein HPB51_016036 [Rhipicephalus microplus]